jgi:3-deoxy-D-manno-octulosonic-acid transferase
MVQTPFLLRAWHMLGVAGHSVAPVLLKHRVLRGKEDPARLSERFGIAGRERPQGRLIWVHGASVGECLAALPLIVRLLADGYRVLVTSGTVTSATILNQRLPKGAIHQYIPLDTPRAVSRFLDYWRPEAGLFVESDLWPNLIQAAALRNIKLGLVNARMSEKSAQGWQRVPGVAAALLRAFDICLAQDDEVAERFRSLGARNVMVVGSLKADAEPLTADGQALSQLRDAIGTRPVLLAAQTHPGEDETILPAHDLLRSQFADLLTIIVPRHPARGADIAMLCGSRPVAIRSRHEPISSSTAIYVADTLGELGLFYRLAPFCFLGGTLVPLGGHNPLEPAALGCAVLAGPHRASARDSYAVILAAQGFGDVGSSADIARQAACLLADPQTAARAGEAARTGTEKLRGAMTKSAAIIMTLLADARA